MSERFVIEIPNEQAQYLRRIAELAGQSIELILAEALIYPIPPTEPLDIQLEKVSEYSNAQLWAIVEAPIYSDEDLAGREPLVQRAKKGTASKEDEKSLEHFSELYNKRGLLRSEALVELQERGFKVQEYLKENAPKP